MIELKPLCPGFGAETHDANLALPLSDEDFAEIERAFYAAQVLVLRAQSLTPAQFARLRAGASAAAAACDRPVPSP